MKEIYPDIDMEKTGKLIRQRILGAGLTVKDIQEKLYLSCPQPIYRWFKGQILPSVNHLYALSKLLGIHMEELLVQKKNTNIIDISRLAGREKRLCAYWNALQQTA